MKKITFIFLFFAASLSTTFANNPKDFVKTSPGDKSNISKTPANRVYLGGSVGATFGDYTQVTISPMIGYRISTQVTTGLQLIYNHSWQYINQNQVNQTTLQSNTYGANAFLNYYPIQDFYLQGEFEYDSYENYQTTQNTKVTEAVPFIFLGMGYSKAISRTSTFYAGIKVDVLNNENSPYQDFTPFFYTGIGIGI